VTLDSKAQQFVLLNVSNPTLLTLDSKAQQIVLLNVSNPTLLTLDSKAQQIVLLNVSNPALDALVCMKLSVCAGLSRSKPFVKGCPFHCGPIAGSLSETSESEEEEDVRKLVLLRVSE